MSSRLVLSLKQAPAATIELLIERPELAVVFWMQPDYEKPRQPVLLAWIARLLGHYEPPLDLPEAPTDLARNGEERRFDQSVNKLLEVAGEPSITQVGTPIRGSDHGFGDERALTPSGVKTLVERLSNQPSPNDDDQLQRDFQSLKDFVRATLHESLGLVVKLS